MKILGDRAAKAGQYTAAINALLEKVRWPDSL